MKKRINIAQFASGSRTDNIGDTTLFYSSGFSKHANDVSGLFLDNPPVLSKQYASLIWRYYTDVDKYILIHVQGSHVVNRAMGRSYPFRAGYEVSRDEMSMIGFHLSALFNCMPRMDMGLSGRVETTKEIDVAEPVRSHAAQNFSDLIIKSVLERKRLFLSLEVTDERYHNDGIFQTNELKTLLTAIELLPLSLRRYATFGFCVDPNHTSVLDDVLVVVYAKDSRMPIPPNCVHLSWEEATSNSQKIDPVAQRQFSRITLPGEHSPILSISDFFRALTVHSKQPIDLQKDEWKLWLSTGHRLEEVTTQGWDSFKRFYEKMDEETQISYVALQHTPALQWPLDTIDPDMLEVMNYSEEEMNILRRKALISYLSSNSYSFLFKDGLSDEMRQELNARFLEKLNLSDKDSVEKWYRIYEAHDCLQNSDTRHRFGILLGRYGVPQLTTLEEIVGYMRKYPFIPAVAFSKPQQIFLPKEMTSLASDHRELIEQWVKNAVSNVSFHSVNDIQHVFSAIPSHTDGTKSLEELSLYDMKEKELKTVLTVSGKAEAVINQYEDLLKAACSLPETWHEFLTSKLLPALSSALFGSDGLLKKETLLDVGKWATLASLGKHHPHFNVLLMDRLEELFSTASKKSLTEQIKSTYVRKESLKQTKDGQEHNDKAMSYKQKADDAYPIIHHYMTTIKKQDKKMAKDLEKLFKDLKNAKVKQNRRRILFLPLLCGAVIGILLSVACLWGYQRFHQSPAPIETVDAIVCAYKLNEKGEVPKDSLLDSIKISRDQSLLAATHDKRLQVAQVIVNNGIKITVPHAELFANDSTTMSTMDSQYYFRLVKYIQDHLPQNVQIAY